MRGSLVVNAAGVPFRAAGIAEIEEPEVRFLLAERMRVDAKGQLGVGVAELSAAGVPSAVADVLLATAPSRGSWWPKLLGIGFLRHA